MKYKMKQEDRRETFPPNDYEAGYTQALKDMGEWLIMSCDELRDRDTEEIDYYGVKPSELESLKKGELPK